MKQMTVALFLVGAAPLALSACNPKADAPAQPAAKETAAEANDPIASAMRAAPKGLAAAATIVEAGKDGKMTELRKGANGWTCMPDNPATPGPDPMCMDANAMAWADAWMNHKTPPDAAPGLMYMLEGGTDASNTDPYATKPDGDWIETGPHIMIVGSQAALKGYPSGARPDTSVPYVMWAGTPYAHLMVPVN